MNAALRQLYFGDGQFYELSPDDDFQFDFDDSLFDAAAREILDNGGYTPDYLTTPTGSALINETNRAFTDAISKGLGEQPDPAVAAALRENAFIFSGFKTHAELEQVAQLLTDENGNIRPFNEFLNDVQKLNKDYNHTYLRTEYNQAVQAAQMASKWADFERDKDFINLQYRTANDERVRASHRILHGVTLPVDDKFWQQYTPPNGWGCRCTVVAVPKEDPDFPVRDAQGSTINGKEVFPTPAYEIFKTNTAKAKKVFPDKHPYLPKSCNTCPLNKGKKLAESGRKGDCTHCENTRSLKEKVQKAIKEKISIKEERKRRKAKEKREKQIKKMQTMSNDIEESKNMFSSLKPIESIPEMVEHAKKMYSQYDKHWKPLFFEPLNGGYVVCHEDHQYTPNKGGGKAEIKVAYILAHVQGKQVEILPENGQNKKKPDLRFDGLTWDVKKIDNANEGSIEKIIRDATKADRIIFYWEKDNNQLERIKAVLSKRNCNIPMYYLSLEGRLEHIK